MRLNRQRRFLGGLAVIIICMISVIAGAKESFSIPTLGGKQIWSDVQIQNDWRLQENVLTGHYRLLDENDRRVTWGSLKECQQVLSKAFGDRKAGHLVIFVHGILRSAGSFSFLEENLRQAGYETTAISYASTRLTIEEHAENLNILLDQLENVETVSFVSHSMGGLVLRQALGRRDLDQDLFDISNVVMIAPPNQGSQIADELKESLFYQLVYGVSGQQLTSDIAPNFPSLNIPVGIIAGVSSGDEGYNLFVTGNDDMVVSLKETHLEGADDFLKIKGLHSTLLYQEATASAVKQFLENTKF
ncbi:esterase/lipase family protein [Curvivirga sp.]|uniref:esterase/lipase family protein n=1 Tax=Curvivirga sp. TaxID=2856848 RepID=UPI003B5CF04F